MVKTLMMRKCTHAKIRILLRRISVQLWKLDLVELPWPTFGVNDSEIVRPAIEHLGLENVVSLRAEKAP